MERVARLPLVTTDLAALLRQVAQRDVDAFATFYDLTRARVFGLVTRVLRDPGYSEETTQDVYLQVWRSAANYDPNVGSPLAWLLTVAHRRAVDRVRSEQAARPARVPIRGGQRRTAFRPRRRHGHPARRTSAGHRLPRLADRRAAGSHPARLLRRAHLRPGLGAAVGQPRHDQVADARRHPRPTQMSGADMTEPMTPDVVAMATPYALHATTDAERAEIERQVAAAPPEVAEAFFAEVRAVRETMAVISAATAIEPPASMRERLLATVADEPPPVRQLPTRQPPTHELPTKGANRWRTTILAAAAVLAIGLAALGVGYTLRPAPAVSTAEQVFAASDVQTISGPIPTGGTATLVFSHEKDAGVLVMNNVPPPAAWHRVSDVAGRRGVPQVGGHDGRQGRRTVDHRGAARPRDVARAGVHGRARQRFRATDKPAVRRAAADLTPHACATRASRRPPRRGRRRRRAFVATPVVAASRRYRARRCGLSSERTMS